MGFNKRYVSIDIIKIYYKNNGLESFKALFSEKIDAFIFTDKLSSDIFDMYHNGEYTKIKCLLRV